MSRKIAFCGIFAGIAAVLLYMGAIMPTGKLTMYIIASLPVAAAIIEFGTGAGVSVYFAVCILSALVSGNILGIVPFAMFFGHYPIFKHFIERGRSAAAEILMKLAVFNLSGLLWYLLFKAIFLEVLTVRPALNGAMLAGLITALQLLFFIYDYVFTRLLFYYQSRRGIFKRG